MIEGLKEIEPIKGTKALDYPTQKLNELVLLTNAQSILISDLVMEVKRLQNVVKVNTENNKVLQ